MKLLKGILYNLLIFLLVSYSFILPKTNIFAEGVLPSLNIDSPASNSVFKTNTVVISGSFADVPSTDLLFTASDKLKANYTNEKKSDSDTYQADWVITNNGTSGDFIFTTKELSDGNHFFTIEIKDKVNQTILTTATINFTVQTRPYIAGIGVGDNLPDPLELKEDITNVPLLDAKIKMTITSNNTMDTIKNQVNDINNTFNPVIVLLGNNPVDGTTHISDFRDQSGKFVYDITFTPSKLQYNSSYFVYLDPKIKDDSNYTVVSKFFKFTTKSDDGSENPHGHYQLNTNTCAGCHSTHVDSPKEYGIDSEGGSYLLTFNEELKKDASSNYCMACHDGTLNAPAIDNIKSTYHHNDASELKQPESCTTCHNPHVERSDTNPNMLKDHYVYTHHDTNIGINGLVDSIDTSCASCHEDYTVNDTNTNGKISIFNNMINDYKVFSYKKSLTATGNSEDFSLCLMCHSGTKASNIKQFYEQNTDKSMHNFAAVDGSQLNGKLPCAECHETHGSNNLFNLKDKFGHENQDQVAFSFKESDGNWLNKEKEYCMKCHNGTTVIYGVTGKIYDETIVKHKDNPDKTCSYCHGGTGTDEQKALRAAHDPQIGVVPTP
jgi:hypothetical protein